MSSLVVVKDPNNPQWWLACIRPGTQRADGKVNVVFFGSDASDTWEVTLTDKEYGKTWCNPINDSTQNVDMEVGSVYTLSMPSGPAEVDRDAWPIDLGFVLGHDLTFQVDHIDKRTGHVFCMFPGMKGRHQVPGLRNMKLTGNDWDGEFQLRRVVWYHY